MTQLTPHSQDLSHLIEQLEQWRPRLQAEHRDAREAFTRILTLARRVDHRHSHQLHEATLEKLIAMQNEFRLMARSEKEAGTAKASARFRQLAKVQEQIEHLLASCPTSKVSTNGILY